MDISEFLTQQKLLLEHDKCRVNQQVAPKTMKEPSKLTNKEQIKENKAPIIDDDDDENEARLQSNKTSVDISPFKNEDPFAFFDSFKSPVPKIIEHPLNVLKEQNIPTFQVKSKTASNLEEQDKHEMEQWVSDTFYQYFPSLNKDEKDKKTSLSRTRQLEYQEYLKNIPQVITKRQLHIQKYGKPAKPKVLDDNNNNNDSSNSIQIISQKDNNNNSGNNNQNQNINRSNSSHSLRSIPENEPSHKVTLSPQNLKPTLKFKELQDPPNAPPRGSPKHRLLEDLKHVDLPTILNTDLIAQRNRLLAEEDAKRKMDYQQELIQQIEEKRKEVERLREKEKMEEEMLTRRLEQQLKTMELEEELEKEKKRTEQLRITNEQNHIRRLQLLSKLENDHKLFNPYDENRKTLSENGKEMYANKKPEKEKAYRYFSNSAKLDNEKITRFATPSVSSSSFDYESSTESSAQRYQYCKNCRSDINTSFFKYGKHTRKPSQKVDECVSCHVNADKLCFKCKHFTKKTNKKNLCVYCERSLDPNPSYFKKNKSIEVLDREESPPRPTFFKTKSIEVLDRDPYPPRSPEIITKVGRDGGGGRESHKLIDIQYVESDNDHDLSVLNPVIVRNNYKKSKKPYSMNVEKESLFHPSNRAPKPKVDVNIRNGEVFLENKISSSSLSIDEENAPSSETDEKIAKYAKHYDAMWTKRNSRIPKRDFGARLPSLSPPKIYVSNRPDNLKSDALKMMERKWDVPAVRRTKLTNESPRVLTQLGAIRKQLQLEQLQMDQTYTKRY